MQARIGQHKHFRLALFRWGFYCFIGRNYTGWKFGVKFTKERTAFGNRTTYRRGVALYARHKTRGHAPEKPHAVVIMVLVK